MPYIDFADIKERVSLDDAAHMLGLKLKGGRTQCPACKGNDRSLAITPGKGFFCFTAKKGGTDCIALLAHAHGCGMKEAAEMLLEHFPSPALITHHSPAPDHSEKELTPQQERVHEIGNKVAELEMRMTALEARLANVVPFRKSV
jgi:hypothetical protein